MSFAIPNPESIEDPSISADSFRSTLGAFASGVTIVTSVDVSGTPHGVTVSAFASLSLIPPLISVNLTLLSRTLSSIRQCGGFNVHILSEEHATLGAWFAGGRDDKFEGVAYTWSKRGLPLLSECHTRMECSLEGEHGGGDHVIVVGLVVNAQCSPDLKPLLYFRRGFRTLGSDAPAG